MASADSIYVDPSALLKLYLKEPESRAMAEWRRKTADPLLVTHHGRVELTNGIGLPAYRGIITDEIHDAAMAALDDDFAQGRYKQGDVLWRATLKPDFDSCEAHGGAQRRSGVSKISALRGSRRDFGRKAIDTWILA
ncbi:MAG: type II toxin-antitoxin system VapC family toxin [Steroidobacteraceae bacterium]